MISPERLKESGTFSPLDTGFADHVMELTCSNDPVLFFTAALLSLNTRRGHICLEIEREAKTLFSVDTNTGDKIFHPDIESWLKSLDEKVTGKPGDFKPFILDDKKRLYLYRYWEYQDILFRFIDKNIKGLNELPNGINEDLDRLFGKSSEMDWQKFAAFTAILKNFCVITGGPGTGKTTTVTKVMALLLRLEEKKGNNNLRIALSAPTGKAAARLSESISKAKANIDFSPEIIEKVPDEVLTIHRLLGSIDRSPHFRYNRDNKLPFDLVIVDEASMVDLALIAKLVDAIPEDGKLILVGDKNQLSSVEAGAVLNDISGGINSFTYTDDFRKTAEMFFRQDNKENIFSKDASADDLFSGNLFSTFPSEMFESIAELKKSYRFGEKNGIGQVSRLVNDGMGDDALKIMLNQRYKNIRWMRYPELKEVPGFLKIPLLRGYEKYLSLDFKNPESALECFDRFRVLCVLKEGPFGVKAINRIVEYYKGIETSSENDFYPGRPVMITRNDYHTGLFNGDTGVTILDENNEMRVAFKGSDGKIRTFHVSALPEHETVYAMTVHKSQGSEFDSIFLITPDKDSQVYTREVVYTAVTRAKKEVEIAGIEKTFIEAVSRRIQRSSGLRDLLWGEQN